jgi:hypothetical protein
MQQFYIDPTLKMVSFSALKVTSGKPAGVRCVQLDEHDGCRIFGRPERPAVCGGLQPSSEMCGESREQAMFFLTELERLTA